VNLYWSQHSIFNFNRIFKVVSFCSTTLQPEHHKIVAVYESSTCSGYTPYWKRCSSSVTFIFTLLNSLTIINFATIEDINIYKKIYYKLL
jgi:hypothetical protein